ncbi:MAG: hypothetical protein ACLTEH_02935 [Clostridia bacterium]
MDLSEKLWKLKKDMLSTIID